MSEDGKMEKGTEKEHTHYQMEKREKGNGITESV